MERTIIQYIIGAIETWGDNKLLGEEIRGLVEVLENLPQIDTNETLASILLMIYLCPTDEELGFNVRHSYIPLKIYIRNVETNP